MKKRIALFLIALCFIFPSAFLLSGCFGSSEHYMLYFYVDGMVWQSSGIARNEEVHMPSDPDRPDYVFKGWFLDEGTWEQPFNENSLLDMDIKSDIYVYAWLEYHEECYWDEYRSNGDGTHTIYCSRHAEETNGVTEPCSAEREEMQPNCKQRGWCDKCCEPYGEILDHNYVNEACTMCNQPEYSPDLEYTLINNGESYEVKLKSSGSTSANGDNGIRIRSSYNGKPVTRIGNNAFNGLWSFEYINIPDTITEIGDKAFYKCGLEEKSIKIPNSVVSIGKEAFYNTRITIEWGDDPQITEIGEKTFYGYLGESLTIPSSVTKIGEKAFADCENLLTCTVPSSVTEIGENAFYSCRALTIYCEASEKPEGWKNNWRSEVVDDSKIVFNIFVASPVVWNCMENNVADDGCEYVIINDIRYGLRDGKAKVARQIGDFKYINETIIIPASVTYNGTEYPVTRIDNLSFADLYIKGCSLPATITQIGQYAFYYAGIKTITLPDGVTHIGNSAFLNCEYLETITMPTKLQSIGDYAFAGCEKLQEIKLVSTLKSIGSGAFSGCKATITWLDTPTITVLGDGAFAGYKGTSLTIPQSVKTIGDYAFENSTATINWGTNPQVTSLGKSVFSGYEGDSLVIPKNVSQIGEYAFRWCKAKTITMPAEITVLEKYSFYMCSSIIYWRDGTKLKTINEEAFSEYQGTTLTLPASVETIGAAAFYGCPKLTTITLQEGVKTIGSSAFGNCSKLTTVSLPGSLTDIPDYTFSTCKMLENVTLGNGIKTLVNGMFKETAITQITLPNSIETVGYNVFKNCTKLKSVTFPSSAKNYDEQIFIGCTALESVTFPQTVEMFDTSSMFYGCKSLKSVTMPKTITSEAVTDATILGYQCFAGCSSLISIELPSSMEEISNSVFSGCSSLVSVTGSVLSKVGAYAFSGCSSLREITLSNEKPAYPLTYNRIEVYAFSGCSALTIYVKQTKEVFVDDQIPATWRTVDSSTNTYCPVVWDCDNNNVADDGYIYTVIDNIRYGIKNNKAYIMTQSSNLTEITLSASITYKSNSYEVASAVQDAFKYSTNISKILFDDTLPNYNFSAWQNLTSVEISNKIAEISSEIFANCTKLTKVYIASSVKNIGENAFANCTNLTKVYIGSSVESIGKDAFDGCAGLTDVYFEGTEQQWQEIVIASGNTALTDAEIHFESTLM